LRLVIDIKKQVRQYEYQRKEEIVTKNSNFLFACLEIPVMAPMVFMASDGLGVKCFQERQIQAEI